MVHLNVARGPGAGLGDELLSVRREVVSTVHLSTPATETFVSVADGRGVFLARLVYGCGYGWQIGLPRSDGHLEVTERWGKRVVAVWE